MAGNFTNTAVSGQSNSTGLEETVTGSTLYPTETSSMGPIIDSTAASGLFHDLITKTAQFMNKTSTTAVQTFADVLIPVNHSEITSVSAGIPDTSNPTTLQPSRSPEPSLVLDTASFLGRNVTEGVLNSLGLTFNSSFTPENGTEAVIEAAEVHPHPHHHWNRTLWRGEVDHHMVDGNLEDTSAPQHFNDVAYIIVVVIFYGAVLILAFVVQMRRRRNYNEVDSEYYGEYLHVKWDVLEKKRLLDKEKVGKMRCLVDAPNVAYIPEHAV